MKSTINIGYLVFLSVVAALDTIQLSFPELLLR